MNKDSAGRAFPLGFGFVLPKLFNSPAGRVWEGMRAELRFCFLQDLGRTKLLLHYITIWNITQWNISYKHMTKAIFSQDHKYTVGQLRKARQEAGLDQVEVAKLLGKTQSHLSKIEAGQRRLDIVQLKEFAKIYKKSLNYFIK